MKTGKELAQAAEDLVKIGGTYQQADCQAFVERAFHRIGVKCDFRGSNDMIRNLAQDVKPIDESIPVGALIFWVRRNGKEPSRYKKGGASWREDMDGWNASHVGIYVGGGKVSESGLSIGRWAITDLRSRGATHYGLARSIDYCNMATDAKSRNSTYAVVSPPKGTLNIRKSADKNSAIIMRLRRWQLVQVEEYDGKWLKIYDIDGAQLGYAMGKFITVLTDSESQVVMRVCG